MASDFERREENDGLTLKLWRGEGMSLLGFDLERDSVTPQFVGFAVRCKHPGAADFVELSNRIAFHYTGANAGKKFFPTSKAPYQKFRWVHFPREVVPGDYRYEVTAMYSTDPTDPEGSLRKGAIVEAAVSLAPTTFEGFLNVGFTRGFASSQAYADKFNNNANIIPPPGAAAPAEINFATASHQREYKWLGFEARRLIFATLDAAVDDPSVTVDAMIYEAREGDVFRKFAALGSRLRVLIDDHDEQGDPTSNETTAANMLSAAGAEVKRLHFGRQQHNKVIIVRRNGTPVKVVAGSTNFSLRGLYIQANNVLVFDDAPIARLFDQVFEAYWDDPSRFRRNALAKSWHVMRDLPGSRYSFCFSPHTEADTDMSLAPVSTAIGEAKSSVLYAVVFLNQLGGRVREALDDLMRRELFSFGVAQRVGGLMVEKPDGSRGLLPFDYLGDQAPEPFKSEWHSNAPAGSRSNVVHHKFIVTDFNGAHPQVFTGSSNLASGGENQNGDHIIRIEDRKVAIAYAIEALRMFDHFHFRVKTREGDQHNQKITLKGPPTSANQRAWWHTSYLNGHVKARDRILFST
jgi:PLD-like domain